MTYSKKHDKIFAVLKNNKVERLFSINLKDSQSKMILIIRGDIRTPCLIADGSKELIVICYNKLMTSKVRLSSENPNKIVTFDVSTGKEEESQPLKYRAQTYKTI